MRASVCSAPILSHTQSFRWPSSSAWRTPSSPPLPGITLLAGLLAKNTIYTYIWACPHAQRRLGQRLPQYLRRLRGLGAGRAPGWRRQHRRAGRRGFFKNLKISKKKKKKSIANLPETAAIKRVGWGVSCYHFYLLLLTEKVAPASHWPDMHVLILVVCAMRPSVHVAPVLNF